MCFLQACISSLVDKDDAMQSTIVPDQRGCFTGQLTTASGRTVNVTITCDRLCLDHEAYTFCIPELGHFGQAASFDQAREAVEHLLSQS